MPALLDHATELIRQAWRFEHSADALLTRYTQAHPQLGARDRSQLADALYAALRQRLLWEALASAPTAAAVTPTVPAPAAPSLHRALALLALAATTPAASTPFTPAASAGTALPREAPNQSPISPLSKLKSSLSKSEQIWLEQALARAADPAWQACLPDPVRHHLPTWLWQALLPKLGAQELAALALSLNQPAPLDVRVNLLKAKRREVQERLLADGLHAAPTALSPWGLRLVGKPALKNLAVFRDGSLDVQDEGSQLLAWLLDARRGEVVVDFCAGAGGKALAIGAMMRNQGRVYAFDHSAHRLEALKPRLARSGLTIAYPMAIAHEQDERIARLAGKVERVLVDAPCSGLGTLRRHPDLKWRQTPATVAAQAATQTRILAAAQALLKPGGRLVYATCSVLPAENADVADAFTAQHRDFTPVPVAGLLGKLDLPAGTPPLHDGPGGLYLQLWPHRHGTDAFFAAVWEKTC